LTHVSLRREEPFEFAGKIQLASKFQMPLKQMTGRNDFHQTRPVFARNDRLIARTIDFSLSHSDRRGKGEAQLSWDIQNLFRSHAKSIARSLSRKGMNEETAADITQDTFLRVITKPPADTAHNHNPKAYLYQVSRNLGINYQRREALIETIPLDDAEVANIADPMPSPEKIVASRQCLIQTYQALSELPERTRRAFEMHRLGERTIAEVAEELGISTTRAWSLIREAYRHLIGRVDPS
jgi:RNA polymerase sigma factor (sigma-70 family)